VRLAQLLEAGPVVLVVYRGAWCPYCNLQLRSFQAALDEIRAAGAQLVAVSPQTPDGSLSLAEQAALEFAVLSDEGNAVAREYGLAYALDDEARDVNASVGIDLAGSDWELPAPATFVIDGDGTIVFASVSGDYRWRVGPSEVLAALRERA
jgi:peroxiredoxin